MMQLLREYSREEAEGDYAMSTSERRVRDLGSMDFRSVLGSFAGAVGADFATCRGPAIR